MISGKGGVGKTHLSLSLAHYLAEKGRKTLLVEYSGQSQYSEFFPFKVSFDPREYDSNIFLASWTGLDCLTEYAGKVLRSKVLVKYLFSTPMMMNLINVAPGLREIAVLGKLTSDYRNINFETGFDDIIFDGPATGHFLSLLEVPFGLAKAISGGPMGRQCREVIETLQNSEKTKMILISQNFEFAEKETEETEERINSLFKSNPVRILQNKGRDFPDLKRYPWYLSSKKLAAYWGKIAW